MTNKVISNLQDPDGWTVENNPHPAPDYSRVYPDKDGTHWLDYIEYYGTGKLICHNCIKRAKAGSGNCLNGGDYFQCVKTGKRSELRRKYSEKKRDVQTKLI